MKTLSPIPLILFLILLLTSTNAHSQSTTSITKLANKHIKLMDQLTKEMAESQKCLDDIYLSLEPGRDPKNSFHHISNRYICSNFLYEPYYTKVVDETKNNGGKHSTQLNIHAKSLYDIHIEINQLCRELEIYIRLGDYKKDQLKGSDEIYAKLKTSYDKYINEKNQYYQFLIEITNANNQEPIQRKMRGHLIQDEKELAKLKRNFEHKVYTANWNIDTLLAQIDKACDRIEQIEKTNNKAASGFISTAKSEIKRKQDAIDKYTYKESLSDGYANRFIEIYVMYYNANLVRSFNIFATKPPSPKLKHPHYISAFKIDKNKKIFTHKPIEYKQREIPQLVTNKKQNQISHKQAGALNNYIDFINREMHYNSDFATRLFGMNKSANRQLERKSERLSMSYTLSSYYALPRAMYRKTLYESKVLDKNHQNVLNTLLDELNDIITESYQIELKMHKYCNSKKRYNQDRYKQLYVFLERYEYLLDAFNKRKQELHESARQIINSYAPQEERAWTKGGRALIKQLDANYKGFKEVERETKNKSYQSVASDNIGKIARQLLLDEYNNLHGLKKIGRNHGSCPYNPYEDVAKRSNDFANQLAKYPNMEMIKRSWVGYYDDFEYTYNDIVDDYNKFVEFAMSDKYKVKTTHLLKYVKQPVFFKLTKPEVAEIIPNTDPVKKDTAKISMKGFAINNLVLLLDVSGSMKNEDKLPLLRKSFLEILPYLRDEDEISIVAFSGKGKVLLNPISCSKKEKITKVLESLESKGQTNFSKGLKLAYKTAKSNFKDDDNNRIIVATDGAFMIDNELYSMTENEADSKTFLSVFSFGSKDKEVRSLVKLAKKGKGSYEYIETNNAVDKLLKELQALRIE